ncbi:MAG: type II secretion system inner membrane protein GspF [Planctomycetota bacterium]|nr:type II secretion system inner membrane protein GspF [Planctomycetota bacterium]
MPIFEYKAYAPGGAVKTGVIDADSPRAARQRLRRENILVKELKAKRGSRSVKLARARGEKSRVSLLERLQRLRTTSSGPKGRNLELVAAITRQLGTLLGAGIPLTEALKAIIDQAESRRVEMKFREIRERITQGASLGDALADHPDLFSDLYVNMVKAGEATGQVDIVLTRLAEFLAGQRALQRKVISSLTYPILMIILGFVVVAILMGFVVPKITSMLSDTGQTMPTPTLILIAVSNWFTQWWVALFLGLAALSFLIERIYKTDKGRLFFDRNLLRIPIIGDLLRKQAVARFSRTLATLLSSGVPAVQSLEITARVVGNRILADATDHIRIRIMEGTDIATPLKASGVFPPVVGYMVAVGEASGELEQMLDRIADSYDEEIDVSTERVTTLLEPLMIIFLATVVGFIVWSIILPILKVGSIQ